MDESPKQNTIWKALGWSVLWSNVYVKLLKTWPQVDASLIRATIFAGTLTLVILLYRKLKGYKSNIWSDAAAWKTAGLFYLLLTLPWLVRDKL